MRIDVRVYKDQISRQVEIIFHKVSLHFVEVNPVFVVILRCGNREMFVILSHPVPPHAVPRNLHVVKVI